MENTKMPSSNDFAYHTKRHFMQDYFDEIDQNGSCHLDRSEIRLALQKMYNRKYSDSMVNEVFNTDDLDKDGVLNYHEARRFCYRYAQYVDQEFPFFHFFIDYFATMNQVGDGKISKNELVAFFRNYGIHANLDDSSVEELFEKYDANSDGHFTFDEASSEFADFIRSIRKDLHGQ